MEIESLVVRYGSVTAVDGVSLRAEAGEVLALLGPNGAGKTSTVETLEGFRRPDAGSVRVLGLEPVGDRRALLPRIGVMLQSCRLYSVIRPVEAVRLFAAHHPHPVDDPDALLDRVGLRDRSRTVWRRLSGGEQQRLALALALVGRPEVVVLDEPTAGLDVHGRDLVRSIIRELRDDGVCVLLTTHELDEAERLADRVAVLHRGRLVALGSLDELAAADRGPQGVRFSGPSDLDVAALSTVLGGPVRAEGPGAFVAEVVSSAATVASLAGWFAEQGLPLGEVRAGRQRLEDVYRRLVEEAP